MLTLKNIKKIYEQSDEAVLDDINLTFNRDEFVSILGCSGAGKSTLLNIIGGLDCKTSGKLLINGKDIYKCNDSNLDYYRKNSVGFIFQNYNLIEHLTVYENVMLPLLLTNYKNKHKRVLKMLDKVGLKDKKDSKICDLSGGQKQRVAISRALINNPDIILADEPTGALDYKTGYEIMNLIKKLSKNKLVIMVTHNKVLAKKYSSRIIYLDKGRVISDTNPSKKKKIYFNMKYNCRNLSIKNALLYSIKTIKAKRKFMERNGIFIPYIDLPFNKDAVEGITISPTLDYENTRNGVLSMTAKKYRNVNKDNIVKSDIPVRY